MVVSQRNGRLDRIGDSISNFQASKGNAHRVASGEYRTDKGATSLSYAVDLSKPEPGNIAHASWLSRHVGVLMLADLLPENLGETSKGARCNLNYLKVGKFGP